MDAKREYSDNVSDVIANEALDDNVLDDLEKGADRARSFREGWQGVNINDVVDRFAPGATPYISNGKVVFENDEHTLAVVADISGGYLRIQDLTFKGKKGLYLTLDGKNGHNITINGKTRGRSKAEYQRDTHFRILNREEM